ncbi:MAG: hybrid sensor histidine kinase/response regulator [Geobacteraceae bacterium GWC2_58_44]|nr:MAG: hybrid sensor histidine kinase/response regulator [Geobacteraceae bacterium GWC2_58_44]HBG07128.1 hybrid sensor histidine kinase/response regulator [Geobacter sp.]
MNPDQNDAAGTGLQQAAILIIDDDSNNLAILSAVLQEYSYRIFVAEDGESGISRAVLTRPGLILLDVLMPGIDGFETCRRLKSIEGTRDIPVIFMTALAETDHKVRGFAVGAVDYVTKPLQREEVLARVGVHLHIRHLAKELQDANESLEKRVAERTVTLAGMNEELQKEVVERKLAEEALAVKQRELEALNADLEQRVVEEVEKNLEKDRILFHNARLAAMGELLSNIAHQWRQPLNSLGLLLQGALLEFKEGRQNLDSFTLCVKKCMEIVNSLSKIISVFQSFFMPEGVRARFDPIDMVEKAFSIVRASYEQNGIAVRIVNDGTHAMTGFGIEFSQVVLNLLNNAKDVLIERGTPDPAVEIRCGCEDGRNLITISDNAGGIPEDILDKIFDPYFTTKFKSQGTGMALYMSKMIIEKSMGGRLSVRNRHEGAEFSVELPV